MCFFELFHTVLIHFDTQLLFDSFRHFSRELRRCGFLRFHDVLTRCDTLRHFLLGWVGSARVWYAFRVPQCQKLCFDTWWQVLTGTSRESDRFVFCWHPGQICFDAHTFLIRFDLNWKTYGARAQVSKNNVKATKQICFQHRGNFNSSGAAGRIINYFGNEKDFRTHCNSWQQDRTKRQGCPWLWATGGGSAVARWHVRQFRLL